MSRTVYLHVGLAKSGTSYVQRMLRVNKQRLKQHGFLVPGEARTAHFMASLDLRGTKFHGHTYPDAPGAWQRVVDEVDRFRGTSLISHETLSRSAPEAIRKAHESFATDDVRVVITARDLARQIPAVWQERLKHGNQEGYGAFLRAIFESEKGRKRTHPFWEAQHLEDVTRRWSDVFGAESTTVVTLPPSGSDVGELWRRFAKAVDMPDVDVDFDIEPANPSLGVAEAELLRRLNGQVEGLPWPQYENRIKTHFAQRRLAPQTSSPRLTLPVEFHDDVRAVSEGAVTFLTESGVRVVGDLSDLEPRLGDPGPMPDDVPADELLAVSLRMLGEYAAEPPRGPQGPGRPRKQAAPAAPGGQQQASLVRRVARKLRSGMRRVLNRG